MTNKKQRPKIDTGGKNHEIRLFIHSTEPLSPPPARLISLRVLQRAGPFEFSYGRYFFDRDLFTRVSAIRCKYIVS